jgi:hypothetical protein
LQTTSLEIFFVHWGSISILKEAFFHASK